jgi:tripartite-type tricarboxylate transporter receptor subunit TctC
MKMRQIVSILGVVILCSSNLLAQEPFYHGKTIRVVVGTSPGNSQDQMTRLVARQLPKYIPGNPQIIIENRPGASSVIAANYLFKIAKGDGLTIGVVSRALYFDQLIGRQEVQFDWTKFTWVGSPVEGNELILVGSATPYKSIRDV